MSSPPRRRRVEVEDIGDVTVVNFTDEKILDRQDVQTVEEQLFRLVEGLGRRKLLIDFANVHYVSSPLLGAIVALNKKLNAVGGRLELRNINARILEVFRLTRLSKLFTLEPDDDEDDNLGDVLSKLNPREPTDSGSVQLNPPPPEPE